MINEKNLERAKNEIRKLAIKKEKPIIVLAQNLEFNRRITEYGRFDILLSVEQSSDIKGDKIKQIDSGLNHVFAKIAAKNKVAIGIDLNSFRTREKKERAILLEKIIQNVNICRKAKCVIKVLNYKDEKNAFNFLISIGASTQQAKNAI